MRKSADLTKREEEMQSGVTSLSARTPQQSAEAAAPSSGAQKAAAENLPVQLIMTLALDFSMAGSEGLDKREKFKRDVAQDLASASGLPAANFRIKDVSNIQNNGRIPLDTSIILDMQVMPDPLAPGTHLLAVKDLAEQAADPSSMLRSGKITSHATGVEVIPPTRQAIEVEVIPPSIEVEVIPPAIEVEVIPSASRNPSCAREQPLCGCGCGYGCGCGCGVGVGVGVGVGEYLKGKHVEFFPPKFH